MLTPTLIREIRHKLPSQIQAVGSLGRGDTVINDLDFVTPLKLVEVLNHIKKSFNKVSINAEGEKFLSVEVSFKKNIIQIDFTHVSPEDLSFTRMTQTWNRDKYIGIRDLAKKRDYTLLDEGLYKDKTKVPIRNYEQLMKLLVPENEEAE